jgi:hypothetical protein
VLIAFGLRKRSAPDGYWDYEALGSREFQPVVTQQDEPAAAPGKAGETFPAVTLLDGAIKALPADVSVVLVVPPAFYSMVARPGSAAAAEKEACNASLGRVVAGRQHSNFINYGVDNALTRDPANFLDSIHYRAKIARRMEQGIADSIRVGNEAKIDF